MSKIIDKNKINTVFVIDEIDHLAKLVDKTGKDILYSITRANLKLKNGSVSLIGISNDVRFKEELDPRVISTLSEEELVFPAYETNEIKEILEDRVPLAFEENTVTSGALNLCASMACREHGDARRAIKLLDVAGKIAELLRIEGRQVSHKKVERLWREEGLQIPQRHRKRKRLYHKDSSVIRLRPKYQNHIWSIDFVHDKLANGRPYKMLTVLDEYSREALCVAVKPRMGNAEVLEVLYPLFLKHGRPEFIRSDYGPEFIAENFQTWLTRIGIKPIRIYPGSPWENGYNARFNGTLRREVLNAEWFTSIRQAQVVIETWLKQYNHIRPHQALNMRPPVPETLSRSGT